MLPPSTTINRPVVEEADALAGLLALLDHLDVQLSPGRNAGFYRVGELVEVEDADALELARRG